MTGPRKVAPVLAQEAEAEKTGKKEFAYDGVTYAITVDGEKFFDDVDVLEMLEDDKSIGILKTLVGPVQWAKFKSKKRTADDLAKFSELAFGVSLGESVAS